MAPAAERDGGGGGGISAYESQPSYQSGVVGAYSTTKRTYPDVSADADPNTGVPIYDSYDFGTSARRGVPGTIGGTSLACPLWAGIVSRRRSGAGQLPAWGRSMVASQTLPELYQIDKTTPADFHDITTGESIGGPLYAPGPGYDLATGLGSPASDLLIPRMVGYPVVTGVSSTQATGIYGAGTAISIQVTFNQPVTVAGGTPQLTLNAGSGAVANYTSGSGTPTLTFTYTVAAGQSSSDLDYASTTALALNGGTIDDALGDAALLGLPTTGTDGLATKGIGIDTTAPTVTNVVVGSTAWTGNFLSYLAGAEQPERRRLCDSRGQRGPIVPLPWGNIDQIKVTFSENVTVDQSDLLLPASIVPSYDVAAARSATIPSTFTATWTLPQPIGADKLMLALNADGSGPIRDAAGNRLDGDWTNPTSTTDAGTGVYPSGDGMAGGDFDFRFNVLPGDATQDGSVGFADLNKVLANYHRTGMSWSRGDVTGDGIVNSDDLNMVLTNYDQTLPSGSPTAGTFPAIAFHRGNRCADDRDHWRQRCSSQVEASPSAVTAATSGLEQADASGNDSESGDSQAAPASSDTSSVETAVSSPADSVPNIAASDSSGPEQPTSAAAAPDNADSQAIAASSDDGSIAAAPLGVRADRSRLGYRERNDGAEPNRRRSQRRYGR